VRLNRIKKNFDEPLPAVWHLSQEKRCSWLSHDRAFSSQRGKNQGGFIDIDSGPQTAHDSFIELSRINCIIAALANPAW
jgi:hypothetical protein